VFVAESHLLLRRCSAASHGAGVQPMRMFHASNLYLALLFLGVAADALLSR
jgi:heme o synthase